MLEAIKEWEKPKEGFSYMTCAGMYMQYNFDRERHKKEIESIIEKLQHIV